ncbi:patatin-like phospholipase family protein [Janthinobacterium sp. GMG1]|uniref:patatin-like phospholipase family protein n=1 Tax=Janthinobacterium sp. GMG1 TaxID=3096007 RepID=UPI002AC9F617|nr:patatin-like phospholipase family protein [Janthinobacterium sp. GMG1]MDZ5637381.1 patatin-like phospholipase family protein [Janthinobacterium sp. GMG1]
MASIRSYDSLPCIISGVIFALLSVTACSSIPTDIRPITASAHAVTEDHLLVNDVRKYRQEKIMHLASPSLCTPQNKRTAFFLTLSGGGSRAAYFAASVLHELDKLGGDPISDKIDGIFSVSGGSIAAALYGVSTDQPKAGSAQSDRPIWSENLTDNVLTQHLGRTMAGQLLNPVKLGSYLFSDLSRTDLLQSAIEKEVFLNTGTPLTFQSLNPNRPPIYIVSTIATTQSSSWPDPRPFGSLFLFAQPDMIKLGVDLDSVSLSQAVTASAAFPGLLSPVSLPRYRLSQHEAELGIPRYVHLIDGGNADNLGLLGVKRILLENDYRILRDCENIVVLAVDAFGIQGVNHDDRAREKSPVGWFFDHNSALASFDALLAANRVRLLSEFKSRVFMPPGSEDLCRKDGLPDDVCGGGVRANWTEINHLLKEKLYFVHLNFDSPEVVAQRGITYCSSAYPDSSGCEKKPVDDRKFILEKRDLIKRVQSIPTTFGLSSDEAADVRAFTSLLNHPNNVCLQHLSDVVSTKKRHTHNFYSRASASCDETPIINRGEIPPAACHIRGQIAGDVIPIVKNSQATHVDLPQQLPTMTHEARIQFLYDAKKKLIESPKFLADACHSYQE